jgi:hypothetical protein
MLRKKQNIKAELQRKGPEKCNGSKDQEMTSFGRMGAV